MLWGSRNLVRHPVTHVRNETAQNKIISTCMRIFFMKYNLFARSSIVNAIFFVECRIADVG